jgi:hypothetical protein
MASGTHVPSPSATASLVRAGIGLGRRRALGVCLVGGRPVGTRLNRPFDVREQVRTADAVGQAGCVKLGPERRLEPRGPERRLEPRHDELRPEPVQVVEESFEGGDTGGVELGDALGV